MAERQEVKQDHLTYFERKVKATGFFVGVTVVSTLYGAALGSLAQGEFPYSEPNPEIVFSGDRNVSEGHSPAELPTGKIGLVIGAAVGAEVARRVK